LLRTADGICESRARALRRLALSPALAWPARHRRARAGATVGQRRGVSRLHPRRAARAAGAAMIRDLGLALLQVIVVAGGAPLLVGALRTMKARLVGRRGPRVLQPYADLAKLLRKDAVVSTT